MEHGTKARPSAPVACLEYAVLDGDPLPAVLAVDDVWTFGRSAACTQTLTLPSLSRVALVLQHTRPGLVRITSGQSGLGRVLIDSDDDREQHVLGRGSSPVHLACGNYTVKVELPPVVLRLLLSVPSDPRAGPRGGPAPIRVEQTAQRWVPERGSDEGSEWLSVAALAVALCRYPELVPRRPGTTHDPVRPSEALRRLAGVWCGRTSAYWVNERLKECITAADLEVPPGHERLAVAVAHYGQVFPAPAIRRLRDELLTLQDQVE